MENKKFLGFFLPRTGRYLLIIFIEACVIASFYWPVSIPAFLLCAFLMYYDYRTGYIRQKEITKYIENLTFNIDSAAKDTLLNFPMPLVVLELDGTIIWYNSSFRKIFKGEGLLEKTIYTLIAELNPQTLASEISGISKRIAIEDKQYDVLGNFVKIDGLSGSYKYILMLYLLDITSHVELERKYSEEKVASGIIVIDNYDDLMQSMNDSSRPQLLAEIDRCVLQWSGFTGGLIKKFERDKYLFFFEYSKLKELKERKFDILDLVKEINHGNKIPVTLSAGFGLNGNSISENFHFASLCIDIALGRGGDQVVIKDGQSFNFYGGKTRELEKRTKVKARVIAHALRGFIDQCDQVMIMGHENCDIDSLGSALGLQRIIRSRDKEVHIVLEHSNPTIENVLARIARYPEYNELFIGRTEALDRVDQKTLLIVVDTHRPSYCEFPELLNHAGQVIVIDHHRRGADFIQEAVLTYQETYASSTCELITEVLQYMEEKVKLTSIEAEALYAGIVIDTKHFTFKTGVRTFEAASYLRRHGVDTMAVKQLFRNDLETYLNISNIVREAEIINDKIAVSVCPPNIKNAQLISAQGADQLLSLSGISAAFVLCNVNSEVVLSGRSLGDINVQVILEKLGGGGHLTVAGAQIPGVSVEEAKEKLKDAIVEYLESLPKDTKE
ncbi:MAG TPA: DHH family phosphoesterase [Clostridia bacterium]